MVGRGQRTPYIQCWQIRRGHWLSAIHWGRRIEEEHNRRGSIAFRFILLWPKQGETAVPFDLWTEQEGGCKVGKVEDCKRSDDPEEGVPFCPQPVRETVPLSPRSTITRIWVFFICICGVLKLYCASRLHIVQKPLVVAVIRTFSLFLWVFVASRPQSCGLLYAHVWKNGNI